MKIFRTIKTGATLLALLLLFAPVVNGCGFGLCGDSCRCSAEQVVSTGAGSCCSNDTAAAHSGCSACRCELEEAASGTVAGILSDASGVRVPSFYPIWNETDLESVFRDSETCAFRFPRFGKVAGSSRIVFLQRWRC